MPINHGTIYTNHQQKNKLEKQTSNNSNGVRKQQNGHFVTKRIPNRQISIPGPLPDIKLPDLPQELLSYIERVRKFEKLKELAQQSNDVLFKCKTVFPFDFFPDSLIVDKTKVNIIYRMFFWSETVHSILIKNIKDVQVESNVLFAKMIIVPDVYMGQATSVSYLHKPCAFEARRVIQGLMLCHKEGLDISDLEVSDIKSKIEIAGTATEVHYAD